MLLRKQEESYLCSCASRSLVAPRQDALLLGPCVRRGTICPRVSTSLDTNGVWEALHSVRIERVEIGTGRHLNLVSRERRRDYSPLPFTGGG